MKQGDECENRRLKSRHEKRSVLIKDELRPVNNLSKTNNGIRIVMKRTKRQLENGVQENRSAE